MSEPGTVEWFLERGVPESRAGELAAIEAGEGHGCVPAAPAEPHPSSPVVGADELADLDALDDPADLP